MPTLGKNARILLGPSAASAYLNSIDLSQSRESFDVTTFTTDGAKARAVGGQGDGTVKLGGLFDTAVGSSWDQFLAALNASVTVPMTIGFTGVGATSPVAMCQVWGTELAVKASSTDLASADLGADVTGGIEWGTVLLTPTALGTTTTSTVVDIGAATANGCVAHVHVTASNRNGTVSTVVEHSVDGSTGWATLATFTTVPSSTTTSERVEVPAGTTVRRYLRTTTTVAGSSGTATVAVALARR